MKRESTEDETGRFTSIDEKWEEYREWSPYNYSENDPIRYSDPTGFSKGEYQNKATPPEGVSSISSPPRGGVNMGSTGLGGGAKGSSGRGSGSRSSGGSGRSGGGGGAIASTNHDYDSERRPMQQQKGSATSEITTTKPSQSTKSLAKARSAGVRKAWRAERELVKTTGEGTRNWTKAEKAELLKTGKVKGYKGHHINNVKNHPKSAADPNNVEFVTQKEHLQRHNGNFKNKTTGPLIDRSR